MCALPMKTEAPAYKRIVLKLSGEALRESGGNPNMGIISGALWKLRYAATCPVARDYLDRGVLEAETWNKLEKIRELVRAASGPH